MSKGKPRHNPDKPQNNYGGDYECENFEQRGDIEWCHDEGQAVHQNGWIEWKKSDNNKLRCCGNAHNCMKIKLQWLASLSEKEKNKKI